MDINLYNIHFLVGLFGKPDRIEYFAGTHENGIDTHGILILQFGDIICQCSGSKNTTCENNVQIMGEKGYIHVLEAKNHKERLIPIHPLLMLRCRELKEKIHATSPDDEYFFMILPGKPMTLGNVYKNFRRYLEQAGISHTGKGPRIHDFRHTYCVNLLRKWADEGKDLIAYLPYMRTMLGHESFEETAYYLKLTAERFPYIKERMKESFPDLIKETEINEHEFY